MLKRIIVASTSVAILLVIYSFGTSHSHSGRTDANGGHYNRKTGEYHYHNSGKRSSSSTQNVKKSTTTIPKYDREDYKQIGKWGDQDKDGQTTRHEVLIEESLISVVFTSDDSTEVKSGKWFCVYTGRYFTDPDSLEIDHFIPLKEVHFSGGYRWSKTKKFNYYNDLKNKKTLIAVWGNSNNSKGYRDPANWPRESDNKYFANKKYLCEYIKTWVELKEYWDLSMDSQEKEAIQKYLDQCGDVDTSED